MMDKILGAADLDSLDAKTVSTLKLIFHLLKREEIAHAHDMSILTKDYERADQLSLLLSLYDALV